MLMKAYTALLRARRRADVGQWAVIIGVAGGIILVVGALFQSRIVDFVNRLFDRATANI